MRWWGGAGRRVVLAGSGERAVDGGCELALDAKPPVGARTFGAIVSSMPTMQTRKPNKCMKLMSYQENHTFFASLASALAGRPARSALFAAQRLR